MDHNGQDEIIETQESLDIIIKKELKINYDSIKLEIDERAQEEISLLKADIIDGDKKAYIRLVSQQMKEKIDEILAKSLNDVDNYFHGRTADEFEGYSSESIKLDCLEKFCFFINNDSLMKELSKDYPVGILIVSDYYLHAYQVAFLRNHFVMDELINWDQLTLNIVEMDAFQYQYRKKHLGYHKGNLFFLYKRNIIEQLINSSFIQSRVEEKESFYFFD